MAAPQVQSLTDIIAQLNPVYDPQRQSINQQISGTQASTQASQAGLDAAKAQAFNQISQQAQNRGMLFSGFTPDQQAQYVGTKYLPASAQLQINQNQSLEKLRNQLLGIDATVQQRATETQSGQQKAAADYEVEQAKLAQELYLAQQSNDTRLQAAAISASGRASGGGTPKFNAAQNKQAVASHVVEQFNGLMGRDKHVSQETWQNGLNDWTAAGGTVRQFFQNYGSYVNPKYKTSYAGWAAR